MKSRNSAQKAKFDSKLEFPTDSKCRQNFRFLTKNFIPDQKFYS